MINDPASNDPTFIIRPANLGDLPALIALEQQSPSAAHWSEARYRALFEPGISQRQVLVAERPGGATLGFLVAHHIATDWELENIVVDLRARRIGVGTRLLEALIDSAKVAQGHLLFLEVRESNFPARGFYEKLSFQQNGRRKAYYNDPREDAILYSLALL